MMPMMSTESLVTLWPQPTISLFDQWNEDILVVARPPIPDVAVAMVAARVHDWRAVVCGADVETHVSEAMADLNLKCPSVAADIVAVTRSFLVQFGEAEASLRIEVVDRASCPKFHCDNVRIRFVTTYHGPGTEYVHANNPSDIRQATTGAMVFLKGHKHPKHKDTVHHRSPAVTVGQKRLCVVLDC